MTGPSERLAGIDETVSAHDYDPKNRTSRNNCPIHLRITAMQLMDFCEAVRFQNGTLYKQLDYAKRGKWVKGGKGHRIYVWAILEGVTKAYTSIVALADASGVSKRTLTRYKREAVLEGKDRTECVGLTFGWGEPPEEKKE